MSVAIGGRCYYASQRWRCYDVTGAHLELCRHGIGFGVVESLKFIYLRLYVYFILKTQKTKALKVRESLKVRHFYGTSLKSRPYSPLLLLIKSLKLFSIIFRHARTICITTYFVIILLSVSLVLGSIITTFSLHKIFLFVSIILLDKLYFGTDKMMA